MTQNITRRAAFLVGGAAALPPLRPALAAFPERAITLSVSFPPGGATDILARILAPPLSEALGKPVVIENRGGAGANIGIGYVARAAGDGYTLLVTSSAFVVNPSLYRSPPYDPFRDFAPISTLGASPNVLAVRPNSGIASLQDLIAQAKASPDKFNYASPGIGTTPHLAGELLKLRAGFEMQHVPFSGAGPATQAALAGTTQVISAAQGSVMGGGAGGVGGAGGGVLPQPRAVSRATTSARTGRRSRQPTALEPKSSRVTNGEASITARPAARSTQMFGPTSATCVTHQRPVAGLVTRTLAPQPKRQESAM